MHIYLHAHTPKKYAERIFLRIMRICTHTIYLFLIINCHTTGLFGYLAAWGGLIDVATANPNLYLFQVRTYTIKPCLQCRNTAIVIIFEGGQFQVFQRFSSSKLVPKTVESCSVALNYYENGSTACVQEET
jgi:hypothetical protein